MPKLIIMRGLPGSGKSTLAQQIKKTHDLKNPGQPAQILSTDDFFLRGGFNPAALHIAHKWNQDRCKKAMQNHAALIIIDNTNTILKEMRPYGMHAVQYDYEIELRTPANNWSWDPKQLAEKTIHNVPLETISKMHARFNKNITRETLTSKAKEQLEKEQAPSVAAATANPPVTYARNLQRRKQHPKPAHHRAPSTAAQAACAAHHAPAEPQSGHKRHWKRK